MMDPIEKIDLQYDTSLSLIEECQHRGHRVFYVEPKNLVLTNQTVKALAKLVAVDRKKGIRVLLQETIHLNKADYIFIRKDPPVDLEYIYMTHILESLANQVTIINSPQGIRDANEKIFTFQFKKWVPPSIVTSERKAILSFQKEIASDLILKPLNQKGGEGIYFLSKNAAQKEAIINRATRNGRETLIAQKFLKKGLRDGDKRILIWNGKIIGAFGRVPKRGEFRANLSLGGTSKKVTVTAREKRIVQTLVPTLKRMGLIFVGLDLIDGFITEINVTSPAGIVDIQELYGIHLERGMVDWLERNVKTKRLRSS